jgi:cellulose synthase/poly-beta-1,6-N-acetylglucosamine synthase-like glycosyltransferase
VVDRLIDACVRLDYPEEKLYIQVLDDSTDCTTMRIRQKIHALHQRGFYHIKHFHRRQRLGYKAGALADGLQRIETECVVIFDADFVPTTDFLRRTMPYFNDNPRLGLIQTRWSHLNGDYNLLTRAQALNIDAHFGVEQVARNRGRLPMSMNGTGGIWRVESIIDAGGWSAATLTEDLDLSYRAYMRGWDFLYLVDVAVPGELPPLVQTYKTQQARWAMGSTQCLVKHLPDLLRARDLSPLEKLMGLLHLAQYVVQPVILLLFLMTPFLICTGSIQRLPNLTLFAGVGIIPPAMIAIGQFELYEDWRRRLIYFPVQFIAAVAIVFSNSWAVVVGLLGSDDSHEFKRTPKFRLFQKQGRIAYQIQVDFTTAGELALATYACFGLLVALHQAPGLAPYMLVYAFSFFLFALWNLHQAWRFNSQESA